jgi:hypothetical protein
MRPRSAGLPVPPGRGRWGRGPAARRPEGRRRRTSASVGGHLPRWQGPSPARGSGQVGFEAASILLQRPRPWARRHCDLRVLQTRRDRSCPPRTCGSRCRADPARTGATTKPAGSGPVRSRTPAALRSSATRDRIGRPGHAKVNPRPSTASLGSVLGGADLPPTVQGHGARLVTCVKRYKKKSR